MHHTLSVPELGENVDSVDVVSVLVSVGDELTVDQPVIEVETDKASVEVPSTTAGRVVELHVEAGDSLATGDSIATLEIAEVVGEPDSRASAEASEKQPIATTDD